MELGSEQAVQGPHCCTPRVARPQETLPLSTKLRPWLLQHISFPSLLPESPLQTSEVQAGVGGGMSSDEDFKKNSHRLPKAIALKRAPTSTPLRRCRNSGQTKALPA